VNSHWHLRKCAKACASCQSAFTDQQIVHSHLLIDGNIYSRHDFCVNCHKKNDPALSTWKTLFHAPESNKEKLVEKKDAESLFRHLLAKENEEDFNAIFILAVMLERKKILIERDVQKTATGQKLRIYERKKTGETFLITDPDLQLDALETVQEQVVLLLGGQPRKQEQEKTNE